DLYSIGECLYPLSSLVPVKLTYSAMRPPAKTRKSVAALSPQVGTMLIGPGCSSVACTLISYGLVVGKHPQDALVRPLMHTSRFDRHGAVCAPLEPSAQLLDTTRRTVPPMAHC